jgi:ferredoxin-nitrite reductase
MRGTVSCTGIDCCHYSLIETKERAVETAQALEKIGAQTGQISLFWSGCANGCANHALADIGLVGKRVRADGRIIEAVDVYQRSQIVANGKPPAPVMTNVPCDELPAVLERMLAPEDGPIC